MWLDAHNVIGIVSLPFHLVMALSAVVFGLHDIIYDTQKPVVYGEPRFEQMWRDSGPFAAAKPDPAPAPLLPLAVLTTRLVTTACGFAPHTLRSVLPAVPAPQSGLPAISHVACSARPKARWYWSVRLMARSCTANTWAVCNPIGWRRCHLSSRCTSVLYGGAPVRWAYFFLGLAGAFLFYSGNLLWIESRRKAQRNAAATMTQRRSTRVLAALTVGVTLGCVAGLSLTLVAGKVLYGHVADLNNWHRYVYYSVFLGSVGWTLLRGAPRAAVGLLWLAAGATLLIPLSSAAGWCLPALGWWAHADSAALGVDLLGLTGAFCFAGMAHATAHRVKHGPRDSVWAAA